LDFAPLMALPDEDAARPEAPVRDFVGASARAPPGCERGRAMIE
jgi:hypothetical protein